MQGQCNHGAAYLPVPGPADRYRCSIAWSKGAVRAILTNPRYTGRQVWSRRRKETVLFSSATHRSAEIHSQICGNVDSKQQSAAVEGIKEEGL